MIQEGSRYVLGLKGSRTNPVGGLPRICVHWTFQNACMYVITKLLWKTIYITAGVCVDTLLDLLIYGNLIKLLFLRENNIYHSWLVCMFFARPTY
jgi:hypothetical protein